MATGTTGEGPIAQQAASKNWRRTFSSLENRSYRAFWISLLFSQSGIQMQGLTGAYLVFDITKSVVALGWLFFVFGAPIVLLSTVGGTMADRVEKRTLLVVTQAGACLVNLVTGVLISIGLISVWWLLLASFLTGIAHAFNTPARQAAVPELVRKDQVMNAVALNSTSTNLVAVASPALAGFLIGVIGPAKVYYLLSALIAVSVPLMYLMPRLGTRPAAGRRSMKADFVEGFRYVRRSPTLLVLIAIAFVPTLFAMPYRALLPAVAADVLHVGSSGLGLLTSVIGIGALIGSLVVAYFANMRYKGFTLFGALLAFAAFILVFARTNIFVVALIVLTAAGATNIIFTSINNTLLLTNSEADMRGRVMGVYAISMGIFPIATLMVSGVSKLVGLQSALAIGAAIVLVFTIVMAVLHRGLKHL